MARSRCPAHHRARESNLKRLLSAGVLLTALAFGPSSRAVNAQAVVCAACVKANLERLAGDELHGRKCGSPDEHAAAAHIAGQLRSYGLKGAFGQGAYLQTVQLLTPMFAAPP